MGYIPSMRLIRLCLAVCCLGASAAGSGCRAEREQSAPAERWLSLRELAGAPARVVWVQDRGEGDDMHQAGRKHALMAFDSESGKMRELLAPADQINKPLIAPDGSFIVFSRRREDAIFRIPWSGGPPVRIGTGFALAVWREPGGGRDWVYAAVDRSRNDDAPYKRIVRFPIDDPTRVEEVWRGGAVSLDSVHVSRDGTRIGGMFPWPRGMLLDTTSGRLSALGRGCWTSLAPDNSYLLWIFDGSHRHLALYSEDGIQRRRIPINTVPGGEGRKMYHPRWSNHARFMVATGPYNTEGGRLSARGAARQVEIWVGRFDSEFSRIEAWARVTENAVGDYAPDLWIAGGATSEVPVSVRGAGGAHVDAPTLGDVWPGTEEGLVFLWSHANARNEAIDPASGERVVCDVESRRGGRWSPSFGMDIRNGSFMAPGAGARIAAACRTSNELTIEATLLPRSVELAGPARIIALSAGVGRANFMLGQEGDRLVFRLRAPETGTDGSAGGSQVELARLAPGSRIHAIVSYRNGELACYIDGVAQPIRQAIRGGFESWDVFDLHFGDEPAHNRTWDGEIDGVAIYNRFVGPDEARRRFKLNAARVGERRIPETLAIRARLVDATPIPALAEIAPYTRALALCEYEIAPDEPPIEGRRRIQVYHWVIQDSRAIPDAIPPAGRVVELRVQRSEDHPQLEAERRLVGIESFDLPEFVDMGR
jgi:hypothetical protein